MKRILLTVLILLAGVFNTTIAQQSTTKQIDLLYNFISDWWRSPYRYGGTSSRGIDCSAFTMKLFRQVYNVPLPRTASEQYRVAKKIQKTQLKDGDLVFFRTRIKSGWHVGVYITDGFFVHSSSKRGVFVSNLKDPQYTRIYYGAGRILK